MTGTTMTTRQDEIEADLSDELLPLANKHGVIAAEVTSMNVRADLRGDSEVTGELETRVANVARPLANKHGVTMVTNALKNIELRL